MARATKREINDAFAELDREIAKLEKKRAAAKAKAKKKPLKKVAPKKTGKVKPRKTTPKKTQPGAGAASQGRKRRPATPSKVKKKPPRTVLSDKPKTKPRKVTKKVVSGTRTYSAKMDRYVYSGKTQAEKDAVRKTINKTEKSRKSMELRAAGYKGEGLKKMLANWEKKWSPEAQARARRAKRKAKPTTQYKKPIGPKPKKKAATTRKKATTTKKKKY